MSLSRRRILQSVAAAGGLAGTGALGYSMAQAGGPGPWLAGAGANLASLKAHIDLMGVDGLHMHGDEEIVMMLYPGFTALDLIGPQFIFAAMMGANVSLVTTGDNLAPVGTDTGVAISPTMLMRDAPKDPTILFVPGGAWATADAMENDAFIDYLAEAGAGAAYVTSVCTGSLLLGMAGLLDGKKATSHWIVRDLLAELGAAPVDERVVVDGNVITGAGVSAGLDFGLQVLAHLRGQPYGEAIQLQLEYDPQPPFDSGAEHKADPKISNALRDMFAPVKLAARKAARDRRVAS